MKLRDLYDAARVMMEALGIRGSLSVKLDDQGSNHGWVGKPGGEDVEVVVTVRTLPPLGLCTITGVCTNSQAPAQKPDLTICRPWVARKPHI